MARITPWGLALGLGTPLAMVVTPTLAGHGACDGSVSRATVAMLGDSAMLATALPYSALLPNMTCKHSKRTSVLGRRCWLGRSEPHEPRCCWSVESQRKHFPCSAGLA